MIDEPLFQLWQSKSLKLKAGTQGSDNKNKLWLMEPKTQEGVNYMSRSKGRGRSRTKGRDIGVVKAIWGKGGREGMCVPKHHTTCDPENGTLQIISKKNYKWFKKALQSNNCWKNLPSSGSKLLKAEERRKFEIQGNTCARSVQWPLGLQHTTRRRGRKKRNYRSQN